MSNVTFTHKDAYGTATLSGNFRIRQAQRAGSEFAKRRHADQFPECAECAALEEWRKAERERMGSV